MKRNGTLIAGFMAVLTLVGVSTRSNKGPENTPAAEYRKSTPPSASALPGSKPELYSACSEIGNRVRRLLVDADAVAALGSRLPTSCYLPTQTNYHPTQTNSPLQAQPGVEFAIATVPNPVSTHLPLMFDRMVDAIQQAAQDNSYSYDDSWFPWEAADKSYPLLKDQQAADELREAQQDQPGVMVFRRALDKYHTQPPYEGGLVVFLVGEKPTGGLSDRQFEHALEWVNQLGGLSGRRPLNILGPSFSGSLPSLELDLERSVTIAKYGRPVAHVSSGTVSSGDGYRWFDNWIRSWSVGSSFWTAMEDDSLMESRFCQYLQEQQYDIKRVAFLAEDETAFGVPPAEMSKSACGAAINLFYPRDIATLRSAYEQQSVFTAARPQAAVNAPSTTLRGDLSEPANSEHDTVRSYGGQLGALAQEAILLDIANRLSEKRIQFVILRSTSSLDQIFISEFLRHSCPEVRVAIDGADLLFTRGAEGRSLRGVMVLSTYPLLTLEQDWTPPLRYPRSQGYRTFAEDISEGFYIAGRNLFLDLDANVPLPDYSPPAWAARLGHTGGTAWHPSTWLTVIGHGQFWPLAVLDSNPAESILKSSVDRRYPIADSRLTLPAVPTSMWLFAVACFFWGAVHLYFCWQASFWEPPRARAYFVPLAQWQHPALVALGSLILAMLAVVLAAYSGLLSWCVAPYPLQGYLAFLFLWATVAAIFFLAGFACWQNYSAAPPAPGTRKWHRHAGGVAFFCSAVFALVHIVLVHILKNTNLVPTYWRSVNLTSGLSPMLPEVLLIAGAYLWFWWTLRGLAHFGEDRPLLPPEHVLPELAPMFSQEKTGTRSEDAARPLSRPYLLTLLAVFAVTVLVCALALQGFSVRTLGERAYGRLIFWWVCVLIAVVLTDSIQMWLAWSKLRQLLIDLDRLPLRRTLRALKGLAWGSLWRMSGNVLEERYRVVSLQFEGLTHLTNTIAASETREGDQRALLLHLDEWQEKRHAFARWYKNRGTADPTDCLKLTDLQRQLASTAGQVLKLVLIPAWQRETESVIFDHSDPDGKQGDDGTAETFFANHALPPHVRAAEEFFVFPYVAFIQNILGRIRTIALGLLWLFVAATLAVSSYPFDPLNVLGGIFLVVFVLIAGVSVVVYSQMSRDATLSHITNTRPGELGWEFWMRLVGFGVGPLMGLLTTLFPSITDFVFSWLQPSVQALK